MERVLWLEHGEGGRYVAMENLGFREKNKNRGKLVNKIQQVEAVSTPAFNVPSNNWEIICISFY